MTKQPASIVQNLPKYIRYQDLDSIWFRKQSATRPERVQQIAVNPMPGNSLLNVDEFVIQLELPDPGP